MNKLLFFLLLIVFQSCESTNKEIVNLDKINQNKKIYLYSRKRIVQNLKTNRA